MWHTIVTSKVDNGQTAYTIKLVQWLFFFVKDRHPRKGSVRHVEWYKLKKTRLSTTPHKVSPIASAHNQIQMTIGTIIPFQFCVQPNKLYRNCASACGLNRLCALAVVETAHRNKRCSQQTKSKD